MSIGIGDEAGVRLSLADEAESGTIGGVGVAALVERFGTPLFVYDLDVVAARIRALVAALPPRFRVAYAVKANPSLAVVAALERSGVGADVASAGELALVRRAGFDPARVMFTGPGKRDDELRAAVEAGIGVVTVESPGELRRLEAIAAAAGRRQPVLLRLAVGEDASMERVQLIGHAGGGKFGMDLASVVEAARHAVGSPHLDWLGLHAFGASNVLDADAIASHVSQIVRVARDVASEVGQRPRLVDAGGGLGIPYAEGEAALDLGLLGGRLAELRREWDEDDILRETEILLEPGRFLVGPAGVFLARIVDVKGPDDALVAILDGGINHLVRPALVRTAQRIRIAGGAGRAATAVTVAGPLCTGLDVFGAGVPLGCPEVGDMVAILDAGAYGYTESMPFFLSHPIPAEVAIRAGEARLIRPRMLPSEILDRQILPDW